MKSIQQFCDDNNACDDGRQWALSNCRTMTEAWQTAKTEWVIWIATREGVLTEKELRIFAVWSARQVQNLMGDPSSIYALDVAERFANGDATSEELDAAWASASSAARAAAWAAASASDSASARAAAWAAASASDSASARAAAWAAASASDSAADSASASSAARGAAWAAAWAAARDAASAAAWAAARDAARDAQSEYLRKNTNPKF